MSRSGSTRHLDAQSALEAAGAGRVHVETVDVTDEAAVDASFASTLAVTGRVDCVFANAGIVSKALAFPDMTSKMYHELLNVSLHGAFYTLRAASRHMRARASSGDRGGSIVICGSLSIFRGLKGMEHYAAAKGALAAMVKSLALELGEFGVRVNMIAPGFILTGMTASGPETDKLVRQMAAVTPLGRVGTPEDIEGPAAYLASDASRFHTGDVLVVDGGRSVS